MPDIDKVAWICIRDRRLLCARSHGKAAFYLPGGKREPGESDAACLVREVREELDVALAPESLHWVGRFEAQADGQPVGTLVTLACYTSEYDGALRACAEIAEIAWLDRSDHERCSRTAQLILDWLHAQGRIG